MKENKMETTAANEAVWRNGGSSPAEKAVRI